MPSPSPAVQSLAAHCADLLCCITPAWAAEALNLPREVAASALRDAAKSGVFRRLLLPGLGNLPLYQPTAKAAGIDTRRAPKFLRAGLSEPGRWRGFIRGGTVFAGGSSSPWLGGGSRQKLCDREAIQGAGYADPVISGNEESGYRIVVPVPPSEASASPHGVITSAATRWLPLLEHGGHALQFATLAGAAADTMRAALAELTPASTGTAARQLADLDARIAADTTGLARIQLARQRAELAAAVTSAQVPSFPWLMADLVEVR
jgi:hypothetical protein